MAVIKVISGHGSLVDNNCRNYLLGIGKWSKKYSGKRCQKVTYINIHPDDNSSIKWDAQMDMDRENCGTNKKIGKNPVRTYNHYIFSPAPSDNVNTEALDAALKEWCERVFQNKFSIVIGYHNDNKNRVQHAHMIINNVNWSPTDKYKRIGSYVTPQCWEYASQLWQYICKERGWYSFIDKQKADIKNALNPNPEHIILETDNFNKNTKNIYKIDEEYFRNYKFYNHDLNYKRPYNKSKTYDGKALRTPFSTKNGRNYTKAALEAKNRGKHLWTDDIRDIIEIAFYQAKNMSQFINQMNQYGIKIEMTRNKDFKYSHPSNPEWRVTGAKLGRDYTRQSMYRKFASANMWNTKYNHSPSSFNNSNATAIKCIIRANNSIHIDISTDDSTPSIENLASMMRTCSLCNAWTPEALYTLKLSAKDINQVKTIKETIKTLNILRDVDICTLKDLLSNNMSEAKEQNSYCQSANKTKSILKKHKQKKANKSNQANKKNVLHSKKRGQLTRNKARTKSEIIRSQNHTSPRKIKKTR